MITLADLDKELEEYTAQEWMQIYPDDAKFHFGYDPFRFLRKNIAIRAAVNGLKAAWVWYEEFLRWNYPTHIDAEKIDFDKSVAGTVKMEKFEAFEYFISKNVNQLFSEISAFDENAIFEPLIINLDNPENDLLISDSLEEPFKNYIEPEIISRYKAVYIDKSKFKIYP